MYELLQNNPKRTAGNGGILFSHDEIGTDSWNYFPLEKQSVQLD